MSAEIDAVSAETIFSDLILTSSNCVFLCVGSRLIEVSIIEFEASFTSAFLLAGSGSIETSTIGCDASIDFDFLLAGSELTETSTIVCDASINVFSGPTETSPFEFGASINFGFLLVGSELKDISPTEFEAIFVDELDTFKGEALFNTRPEGSPFTGDTDWGVSAKLLLDKMVSIFPSPLGLIFELFENHL